VASQLGSWLGQARRMTRVMKRQLEDELNLEKDLRIRPPRLSSPLPPPTPASPRQEYDDTYSTAHDAGSIVTGVGDQADAVDSRKLVESGAQSDKDTSVTGKGPADATDERGAS
ncbi:MAG TPA: hypothetical protein VF389_07615, partial [Woeseiaceae bacterium]